MEDVTMSDRKLTDDVFNKTAEIESRLRAVAVLKRALANMKWRRWCRFMYGRKGWFNYQEIEWECPYGLHCGDGHLKVAAFQLYGADHIGPYDVAAELAQQSARSFGYCNLPAANDTWRGYSNVRQILALAALAA
jgi:hypothetical protein